nr:hypothetical protein BaRGS_010996 [Batillaria attramentaria]
MSTEFPDVVKKFEKMAAGELKQDMYTMKSSTRGRFVMYSNRTFTAGGFKDLPVEPDEDALHALFDEMGFSCAKKLNMTREKMISDLNREMRNSKGRSYDCFAMAVTSHGNNGVIFSSDGQEVKIQELRAIVDQTKEFHGKPKIFLIDACQGGKPNIREKGPGEDGDAVDAGPKFADNYTAVATVPSFTAGARVGFGSFFLQAVAYIFSRYACTEEINEMMTKVNHLVSLSGRQMPEYTTSLRQKLFFFPGLSK